MKSGKIPLMISYGRNDVNSRVPMTISGLFESDRQEIFVSVECESVFNNLNQAYYTYQTTCTILSGCAGRN